jgi:hypothetical protein
MWVRNRKTHLVHLFVVILWIKRMGKDGFSVRELLIPRIKNQKMVEAAGVEP